ncbi:manganese ion homeostasis [Diplodia corticola]|uniref:Manganese ion homeostasis n=1 Tax=Diplodia corticola TaxID=236234 RepID=A0A1J9QLX6_9PEZI|nr:manganese ion homeostasis [Diplodia corticola]OJD29464.1 manganese ion homeostasis [Diplodia corticola]
MTSYDDWGYPISSSRNRFRAPSTVMQRIQLFARSLLTRSGIYRPNAPAGKTWNFRPIFSVPNILTLVWVCFVYSNERSAFRHGIEACDWANWESWPHDATPHRLVFVADPQLVDPHTYPGRPWPLSTLTVAYTDQYLRRSWSLIQEDLYPDTVFFLGDLFDGGREWTADGSVSEDKTWKQYGDSFWLREYDRFGRIFFDHWGDAGMAPRLGQPGRKVIAGLPGNHDLGFAAGIRTNVRKRFNAYFGDGNRVDVVANHTFVSIDAVSLSALGHAAGSQDIWKPTQDFLDQAQAEKRRAVARELRARKGLNPTPPYKHKVVDGADMGKAKLPVADAGDAEFPTILLTHVPLYRAEGTPCGPLREHWPPTEPPKGQKEPVFPDHRNAIAVRGGYQYQNVLTKDVSKDVTEKIGNIEYAFSGDDHDYCEVVHKGYQSGGHSGIREITVKSLSWAMGVRRPGFVMLSLWNPVDDAGQSLGATAEPTVQSHLCLMPDQLGAFIRYAVLFAIALFVLMVRALVLKLRAASSSSNPNNNPDDAPILPLSEGHPQRNDNTTSSAEQEKRRLHLGGAAAPSSRNRTDSTGEGASSNSSTASASDNNHKTGLSSRSASLQQPRSTTTTTTTIRNPSPVPSGGGGAGYGLPPPSSSSSPVYHGGGPGVSNNGPMKLPLVAYAGFYPDRAEEKKREKEAAAMASTKPTKKPRRKKKGEGVFREELGKSVVRVAAVVLTWYAVLTWSW